MGRENWKSSGKNVVNDVSLPIHFPPRKASHQYSFSVQSYLQHYTEPSTDPLPTSNSTLSTTLLPLGPGSFTHNSAGVPIIVTCTKADLIDDGNDMAAGTSGMGSMVKGKGGEWEERTDGIMQVLRTICLKCKLSYRSFFLLLKAPSKTVHHYSIRRPFLQIYKY